RHRADHADRRGPAEAAGGVGRGRAPERALPAGARRSSAALGRARGEGGGVSTAAILLCAGKGERLGMGVEKALVPLGGRPLFTWSLEAFEKCAAIDTIVMVGPVTKLKDAMAASGFAPRKILGWTEGGKERQHSVGRGLHLLPEDVTHVAVHDCA